ncbi:DoxX family protein [Maribacter litoralis]|uniref:DoxX family protein n=1 Tax=Maribacter litoralis TaxID=2059726 RepID=UPI003F5CEB6A
MKPLVVLITVTLIAFLLIKIFYGSYDISHSARIGMSVMLLFTAMGHFMFPDGMTMMLPDAIPLKKEIIYFTGVIEIAAAIGLQLKQFQNLTAWLLIVFFIIILPANIKGAIDQVNFQKGTYNGFGVSYLWFRVPLQILFILWVYLSSIRFS